MSSRQTQLNLGQIQVEILSDGTFWLDGGAMYGITPKPVWNAVHPGDEKNRVPLGLNCLLVQREQGTALVESGIGTGHDEKFAKIFKIQRETTLMDHLATREVKVEDIKTLVLTHVHFDHSGWITRPNGNGFDPTFPNAQFYVQKKHWDVAMNPHRTVTASFLQDRLRPWNDTDRLHLVEGEATIDDDIRVFLSEGHTEGHQTVVIKGQDKTVCFVGDLIPTPHHVRLDHIMAYDRYPEQTLENKVKLLAQAAEEGWHLVFPHDPEPGFAVVEALPSGEYELTYI